MPRLAPAEYSKTIRMRHLQVEQNNFRKRIKRAVVKISPAHHVIEDFSAAAQHVDGIFYTGSGEGAHEEKPILLRIVRDQDERAGRRGRVECGSISLNLLGCAGLILSRHYA